MGALAGLADDSSLLVPGPFRYFRCDRPDPPPGFKSDPAYGTLMLSLFSTFAAES
jgi:hypothetical protein